jgi:hypothetical protein
MSNTFILALFILTMAILAFAAASVVLVGS